MTCDKIKAADFGNDGFKDISFNFQQNGINIYKSNQGLSFSLLPTPALNGGSGVQDFGIGDFNSDGLKDIAFGHTYFSSSVVSVLLNSAGSGFSVVPTSISVCNGGSTNALTVGDYDLDGKDDIVISHSSCYNGKSTSVFRQTASGSFSLTGLYSLIEEAEYLFMKDINMDSYPDIVFSEASSGKLEVYLNNKAGGFYKESLQTLGRVVNSCYGDFNNDSKTDIATIGGWFVNYISIQLNNSMKISPATNQTICSGSTIVIKKDGPYPGFSWMPGGSVADSIIVTTTGTYSAISAEGINGCTSTVSVNVTMDNTCADVWPGDANSDGLADNLDVLELGLHYSQTGPARATTSNNWQSYFANNWTGTITNGKNLNHSDCNGDGTINDDDTLAIYNNYSLTHAFKTAQTNTVNPQLSIVPDQASVVGGVWGTASIYLGDETTNINNINGLAFTINLDNTLIEPNSIYIEYQNSFIDASQNLHFRKLDFASGKIHTATTHTNNTNVSGYGKIATLHYQIKSTLTVDDTLTISLALANQSSATGIITPLTSGSSFITVLAVGIEELKNNNFISINPNPTNGLLTVNSKTDLQKIEVISITGQILLSEIPASINHTLHLENFANGIYFVNMYQNNRIIKREKVVLNK